MALRSLGNKLSQLQPGGSGFSGGPAPLAIDFGASALKLLLVSGNDRSSLGAAAMVATPEELVDKPVDRLTYQIDALAPLIKAAGIKAKRAVASIPTSMTHCKLVRAQAGESGRLDEGVGSALALQFGRDPSTIVHRHYVLGDDSRGSGKTDAIAIAAMREHVDRIIGAIHNARLEPVGIHNEFTAIQNAFESGPSKGEKSDESVMYLDIGFGSTKVVIVHGSRVAFVRAFEFGGTHLDRMLEKQLKLHRVEAQKQRLSLSSCSPGGSAEGPAVAVAEPAIGPRPDLSEGIEAIRDEVSACLRFHESVYPGRGVDRLVFCGGESRHTPMCESLARALRIRSQVADPLARLSRSGGEVALGVDVNQSQPGWAVAYGLCVSPTDL